MRRGDVILIYEELEVPLPTAVQATGSRSSDPRVGGCPPDSLSSLKSKVVSLGEGTAVC